MPTEQPARMRSIGAGQTLLAVALLFFPPTLAAGASIISLPVFGVGTRIYKPIVLIFALLAGTSFCAVLASYVNANDSGEAIKALKFLFMALCFISGYWLRARQKDIKRLALILSVLLVVWYTISVQLGITLPSAFRPPDNNGSSILLFFLTFILAENQKLSFRLILIAFLFFFSTLVDSRLLLVLLPFFFLSQPISFSVGKVFLFIGLFIAVYIWSVSAGMWGNFSDVVRLELYATTFRYLVDSGFPLISNGQNAFIYEINMALPTIISERLDVNHAHNGFFQVLGGYGLLAGLGFIGTFLTLIWISRKLSDETLRNQTLFLISVMMIETVVSDSRIAYIAFLFMGLQIGAAKRRYRSIAPAHKDLASS